MVPAGSLGKRPETRTLAKVLELELDALLALALAHEALKGRARRLVGQLEVGRVAPATEANDVVGPGAAERVDEVVVRGGDVLLDRHGEVPQARGGAEGQWSQAHEFDTRVVRLSVAAADDDGFVARLGEVGGEELEVSLDAAALRVT